MTAAGMVDRHDVADSGALARWWGRALSAVDETVDYRALVPLRIVAGLLVPFHLAPFLADAANGVIYSDRFSVPYAASVPELSRDAYVAALWLAAAGGVLVAAGLFTRTASAITAGFVVYNLMLSQTHYHHNRAFLAVLLVGLALVPVGGAVSIDAWRARRRGGKSTTVGRRWPLILLRFQLAAVYCASGLSKLLDGDWLGGVVTQLRVEAAVRASPGGSFPAWLVDIARDPTFHSLFAPIVVVTEIFIGVGLLMPRTRTAATWVAVVFHVSIELTASVQVFSWAALAALVVWVSPTGRDREVVFGRTGVAHGLRAEWVRWLDWTGRFRVRRDDATAAHGVALWERDGSVVQGRAAVLRVIRLLPATFMVAAPLSLVVRRPVQSGATSTNRRRA